MTENRLLYFALGVLTVIGIGAANSLALRNEGIEFPDGTVQTTAATTDTRRAFYLTASNWDGASALNACDTGFHMASMWEILDVSNLRYAVENPDALTEDDSGVGPPAAGLDNWGWVRTGNLSSNLTSVAGRDNCNVWTTTEGFGTVAQLEDTWFNAPGLVVSPWETFQAACADANGLTGVWCVAD